MKQKRVILKILVFLILSILLCGYGPFEKVPDLVNVAGPFIDLGGSVGDSIGNAEEAYEAENMVNTPTGIPDDMPTPTITPIPTPMEGITPTPIITQAPAAKFTVLVGYDLISDPQKDKAVIISVNDRIYEDINEALEAVSNAAAGKTAVLIDNFAEAETFRTIIRYCEDNNIRYETETREK